MQKMEDFAMRPWFALLLMALLSTSAGAQEAKPQPKAGLMESVKLMALNARDRTAEAAFRSMSGNCGSPCLMPADSHMLHWAKAIAAATAVKNEAKRADGEKRVVVINVACRGECALFADIAREQVCLGPKAEFKFYRVASGDTTQFVDPPFSKRVGDWIVKKLGGKHDDGFVYPIVRDLKDTPTMGAEEAVELGFWDACSPEILAKALGPAG
jgi:hypothetical protein